MAASNARQNRVVLLGSAFPSGKTVETAKAELKACPLKLSVVSNTSKNTKFIICGVDLQGTDFRRLARLRDIKGVALEEVLLLEDGLEQLLQGDEQPATSTLEEVQAVQVNGPGRASTGGGSSRGVKRARPVPARPPAPAAAAAAAKRLRARAKLEAELPVLEPRLLPTLPSTAAPSAPVGQLNPALNERETHMAILAAQVYAEEGLGGTPALPAVPQTVVRARLPPEAAVRPSPQRGSVEPVSPGDIDAALRAVAQLEELLEASGKQWGVPHTPGAAAL